MINQNNGGLGGGVRKVDVRKLTTMGMLSALAIVLVYLIHFPLFPAAPFLEYDPADVAILIGTMIYGPVAGLAMTILVSFLQAVMISSASGVIGFVMHVVATGAMVLVAGLVFRRGNQSIPRAAVALALGAVTMTVAMIGMNLVLTPIFTGTPVSAVKEMLIPVIIPFNLIKAGVNCAVAFVLYRAVEKLAVRHASTSVDAA